MRVVRVGPWGVRGGGGWIQMMGVGMIVRAAAMPLGPGPHGGRRVPPMAACALLTRGVLAMRR